MATRTLTRRRELVLRLSIPVSSDRDGPDDAGDGDRRVPDEDRFNWTATSPSSDNSPDLIYKASQPMSPRADSQVAQLDAGASVGTGAHNSGLPTSEAGANDSPGFEGDRISPAKFNWMARIPPDARSRLLLAIEPASMARRQQGRFSDKAPPSQTREGSKQRADGHRAGIIDDFCVPFSRDLLRKLRESQSMLQRMASRTHCLLYVRKTLLLRGTVRTKTWTKYFMCRVYCIKQTLLNRFYSLLEQFDASFCSRHACTQSEPRVTLVPNRTVPENTFLRMTRQRLRKCDNYFGKMPLLPDPYLTNLAAKLTANCVNESSLLAQLVMLE